METQQNKLDLSGFYGTEGYHQTLPGCYLTDGVLYLAEELSAFWITDVVFSHVVGCQAMTDDGFGVVRLTPQGRGARFELTDGDRGDGEIIRASQDIEFTDLDWERLPYRQELTLYVQGRPGFWVIMLPSEY